MSSLPQWYSKGLVPPFGIYQKFGGTFVVDEIMVLGSAGIEWPGPRDTTHHQ